MSRKLVYIIAFLTGIFAGGCGALKKKESAKSVAQEPETIINDLQIKGTRASVRYSSNITAATFSCKLEAQGQMAQWQGCPQNSWEFDFSNGAIFSVKALANGVEDKTPAVRVLQAQEIAGSPKTEPQQPANNADELLTAIINEKSSIGDIVRNAAVNISFGAKGKHSGNVKYDCLVDIKNPENTSNQNQQQTYNLGQQGQDPNLNQQQYGNDPRTQQLGYNDPRSGQNQNQLGGQGQLGQGQLPYGNDPRLGQNQYGSQQGGQQGQFGQGQQPQQQSQPIAVGTNGQYVACNSGYALTSLIHGQVVSVTVRPYDETLRQFGNTDTLTFRVELTGAGGGSTGPGTGGGGVGGPGIGGPGGDGSNPAGGPTSLVGIYRPVVTIGSYTDIAVPQDMYTTKYATDSTVHGLINYEEVLGVLNHVVNLRNDINCINRNFYSYSAQQSPQFMPFNRFPGVPVGPQVSSNVVDYGGIKYCQSQMDRDSYNALIGKAYNMVEFATRPEAQQQMPYSVISIAVFEKAPIDTRGETYIYHNDNLFTRNCNRYSLVDYYNNIYDASGKVLSRNTTNIILRKNVNGDVADEVVPFAHCTKVVGGDIYYIGYFNNFFSRKDGFIPVRNADPVEVVFVVRQGRADANAYTLDGYDIKAANGLFFGQYVGEKISSMVYQNPTFKLNLPRPLAY